MKSAFEVINQNQTGISCIISIILSIVTSIVTVFLQKEISPAESFVKYSAYRIGYQDAVLKSNVRNIDEIATNAQLDSLDRIIVTLKVSCGLAFLASFLHFSSSVWALYKRSKMSNSAWLVAHSIALVSLITAVSLPLSYPLKGPLILNLLYAIVCVDAFLTLLLIVAVYLDQRSSASEALVVPDVEKEPPSQSQAIEETPPKLVETAAAANNSSVTEEEPLPPPPPPPTTTIPEPQQGADGK
ncbi:unnamed protein product [Allacma fusca]|uniref:Uncharacterized protein n=1 Tax=Allacma fusca TaxID=39272 RepID=A0A8J2PV62_9HEXA|nr:unnamed protein product [Allacma fusca]